MKRAALLVFVSLFVAGDARATVFGLKIASPPTIGMQVQKPTSAHGFEVSANGSASRSSPQPSDSA